MCVLAVESARASGLFPSMDEDNSYVGPIELPSLTYLNFSDNSLAQIPRELNLASCTRLKKVSGRFLTTTQFLSFDRLTIKLGVCVCVCVF